jgi:NAD-dependent SIR2 family protein deacetylase
MSLYDEDTYDADAIAEVWKIDAASEPDMLVVVGTTLKVGDAKKMVKDLAAAVKRRGGLCVWINNDPGCRPLREVEWDVAANITSRPGCIGGKEGLSTSPSLVETGCVALAWNFGKQ